MARITLVFGFEPLRREGREDIGFLPNRNERFDKAISPAGGL